MKSLKIFLLLAALLFCKVDLYAQKTLKPGDISIFMHFQRGLYDKQPTWVNIYKNAETIKIKYESLDSVKNDELKKDTAYIRISEKKEKLKSGDTAEINASLDLFNIQERFSVYTRDSITFNIKSNAAYKDLIKQVAMATENELAPPEKNGKITLYGNHYTFSIKFGSEEKELKLYRLDESSHPLLYKLLKSTLTIGREKNLKIKGFFGIK